jgi:hypothetical protein
VRALRVAFVSAGVGAARGDEPTTVVASPGPLGTAILLPIAIPTATNTTAARPLRIQRRRLGRCSLPRAAATT